MSTDGVEVRVRCRIELGRAERERFELSVPLGTSAFKAGAFGRSATVPSTILGTPAHQLSESDPPTPAGSSLRLAYRMRLGGDERRVGGLLRDAAAEVVDPVIGALPGGICVGADAVGVAAGSRVGAEELHTALFGVQIP